jgi:hypothetical protein
MFICMCTFILCLCCLTQVEVLRRADHSSKESYRVCLNRFRNPIGRPRPDSGLLRHRKKTNNYDNDISIKLQIIKGTH